MTPDLLLTVVGSINIDLTSTVVAFPQPGETVLASKPLVRELGGKGSNQARAAARLTGRARMIGAVGEDLDGTFALDRLSAAGVDISGIVRKQQPTGAAMITVDASGENTIVVNAGANDALMPEDIALGDAEATLCQLEISVDCVAAAARQSRGFFAVNAAPARQLPAEVVEASGLIIVNDTEYAALPELGAARCVAVTSGADGAAIYHGGRLTTQVHAFPATVVSTVGAGDAFCAALTLCLARGDSDTHALRTACAVGAAAVEDPRSQPELEPLAHYSRSVTT
ncbi:MAG TPA: ribokinase [Solirubrobacteraceae bacterium]|nr:ribokinase [Solirubrobacteraceae bacterium]